MGGAFAGDAPPIPTMAIKRDPQKKFLQRRAIAAKESEICCDCPGCKTCKGFVRNCHCDDDWDSFREARQGIRSQERGIQLGSHPENANQTPETDKTLEGTEE